MKILYIMDPIEKINVMGDSTFVLMMESQNDLKIPIFALLTIYFQ